MSLVVQIAAGLAAWVALGYLAARWFVTGPRIHDRYDDLQSDISIEPTGAHADAR